MEGDVLLMSRRKCDGGIKALKCECIPNYGSPIDNVRRSCAKHRREGDIRINNSKSKRKKVTKKK